jgi:hypothetical protein
MQLGRGKTAEEQEAKNAAKEAENFAKEQRRAAEQHQKTHNAFLASPVGQARTAYARGDAILQLVFDVMRTQTYVVVMSKAGTTTQSSDPTVILNAVSREGWELVTGSFVFLELGSESRDKFMRSGQQIAVSGTILGYYLFRRSETHHVPQEIASPSMQRSCPHCGSAMEATERTCPSCSQESEPWVFTNGLWWQGIDGIWHALDPKSGEWQPDSAAPSS